LTLLLENTKNMTQTLAPILLVYFGESWRLEIPPPFYFFHFFPPSYSKHERGDFLTVPVK
jgi:hypothetical protein